MPSHPKQCRRNPIYGGFELCLYARSRSDFDFSSARSTPAEYAATFELLADVVGIDALLMVELACSPYIKYGNPNLIVLEEHSIAKPQ